VGAEERRSKPKEIGRRIAQARHEAGGMTQPELAELIKVAPRTMQAYEQGEIVPYKKLRELERFLNRPAAWFLHGDDALRARDDQFDQILKELRSLRREVAKLAERVNALGRDQKTGA
jgi:transcriptional regulator with XRE-family HTH domain